MAKHSVTGISEVLKNDLSYWEKIQTLVALVMTSKRGIIVATTKSTWCSIASKKDIVEILAVLHASMVPELHL